MIVKSNGNTLRCGARTRKWLFSAIQKQWSKSTSILLMCLSVVLNPAHATESIEHFRAIPIAEIENDSSTYLRHTIQDRQGYIWLSGSAGLNRFDGYSHTPRRLIEPKVAPEHSPFLFKDSTGTLYVGEVGLHYYNENTDQVEPLNILSGNEIRVIDEDTDGNLWLAGIGFGIVQYNKNEKRIVNHYQPNTQDISSIHIESLLVDKTENTIWYTDTTGLYKFDIKTESFHHIQTPLDNYFSTFQIRDISLDQEKRELWVGTQRGLLVVNVDTKKISHIDSSNNELKMPVDFVTTTFIDKDGDIWLGFEKAGACRLKKGGKTLSCMSPSSTKSDKLPFASVEDISQDNNGNLWFSLNHFGVARVTPHLEKISSLKAQFESPIDDYFQSSFDGVVRENGDVWIATDGGGLNIFNYKNKTFSNIKNIPKDINTPSSNSIISLTEDEYGAIWAGTWAGGMFKIDPDTKNVTRFMNEPSAHKTDTIASNFVFVVESDRQDGIWMSIWEKGLQYYNQRTGKFIDYLKKGRGGNSDITNNVIYHLQYFEDKLFIAGESGLEYFDVTTQTFTLFESLRDYSLNFVLVKSFEEIWLGSEQGLIRYNMLTDKTKVFTKQDGLSDNLIHYITEDKYGKIWAAAANGITVIDLSDKTFKRYFKRDGLVGLGTSAHGEFIHVGGKMYIPSRDGVSIMDPEDLPFNGFKPTTVLSKIEFIHSDESGSKSLLLDKRENNQIEHKNNSLRFSFSSLSFVFPEHNQFKYRLIGWQDDFVFSSASERFATYTNLPTGEYVFEIYSANSSGIWDEKGTSFDFTILPPWWATWWAIFLFVALAIASVYGLVNLRLSLNIQRERELKRTVAKKTKQLEQRTLDLKTAGESLEVLNRELEQRVEQRTTELQLEINERKAAEYKLFYMAFHDSLTELPNRQRIVQVLEQLIEKCKKRPDYRYGVMFLDGDRFKQINDTYGHIFGDKLLIACAERLQDTVEENDFIGRLGGDEFTVISKQKNVQQLEALAQQIVKAFKRQFIINGQQVLFNVSIGVLPCSYRYQAVPEVLRNADIAMYRAKASGKGTYKLFDARMQQETLEEAELELGLREALNNDGFSLAYQPIINLHTGKLDGFEALIRWEHPEKGLIPPVKFIPIAEEAGLIWEIGKWVLEQACKTTKHWHEMLHTTRPNISVNLSTHQLRNESFLTHIDETLRAIGLSSSYLKLEITESVIIENNKILEDLYASIRERKIDLAIDDFGTGYSSLAYLSEIPMQFIKIDRRFIAAIDNNNDGELNEDALSILNAIVSLAKSLGKQVTAEGIETRTQLQHSIRAGCDFVQGYYMSKPLNHEQATQLLKHSKPIEHGGVTINKRSFSDEYKYRKGD